MSVILCFFFINFPTEPRHIHTTIVFFFVFGQKWWQSLHLGQIERAKQPFELSIFKGIWLKWRVCLYKWSSYGHINNKFKLQSRLIIILYSGLQHILLLVCSIAFKSLFIIRVSISFNEREAEKRNIFCLREKRAALKQHTLKTKPRTIVKSTRLIMNPCYHATHSSWFIVFFCMCESESLSRAVHRQPRKKTRENKIAVAT